MVKFFILVGEVFLKVFWQLMWSIALFGGGGIIDWNEMLVTKKELWTGRCAVRTRLKRQVDYFDRVVVLVYGPAHALLRDNLLE